METSCDSLYTWLGLGSNPCRRSSKSNQLIGYYEEAHNIRIARAATDSTLEYSPWLDDFNLAARFNSTSDSVSYVSFEYVLYQGDALLISGDVVTTSVKEVRVYSAIPGGYSFAHSIGLLGSSFSEGGGSIRTLVYAQVGGMTYGTFRVAIDPEFETVSSATLTTYPNPSKGQIDIRFEMIAPGEATIVIHNMLGQQVRVRELGSYSSGTHTLRSDLSTLANGLYNLSLVSDGVLIASSRTAVLR